MDEILNRHSVQKRLAIVMSLLMVLSLLPDSLLQVRAEDNEAVITVTDDEGAPVEGAVVSYKVSLGSAGAVSGESTGAALGDSVSDGDVSLSEITGSGTTDNYGKIAISIPDFTEGMTISLEISKEGFGKRIVPEQSLGANIRVSLRKIPEIQALDGVYNKENQELVSVSCSANADDVIRYSTDGADWQESVPTGKTAGEYSVYVQVEREGYELFESGELTAIIRPVSIQGLTATLRSGLVYNGQEQELLEKVDGLRDGDRVFFAISGSEDETQPIEWTELTDQERPQACDAGSYKVRIKVVRENNEETEIELSPAEVSIQKAEPELKFVEEPGADTVDFDRQGENTYIFSVSCNELQPQDIRYSVENAARDDETDIADIASIVESGEEAGKLTVTEAGHIVRITATTAETPNYTSASKTYVFAIRATDDLIRFGKSEVKFILGTDVTISAQEAEKSHEDDNGAVRYEGKVTDLECELEDIGIELSDKGQVSVKDLGLLSDAIGTKESLSVIITAYKGEGTKKYEAETREVYAECQACYTILLSTEEIPDEAYTKYNSEGEEILSDSLVNGGSDTEITVLPAAGYMIARDKVTNSYDDSVVFGDAEVNPKEDQDERFGIIYLKNEGTGGITAPITIDLEKMDSGEIYDLCINFPDSYQNTQDGVMYYDGEITIVFSAKDDTSGVDTFCWSYVSSDDTGTLETASGELEAEQDEEDPTKYTASLTLPEKGSEQLRGYLEVSARDVAGNNSDILQDDRIFVVDTISPCQSVSYGLRDGSGPCQTVGTKHYFSGPVEFVFHITEANFFSEDVQITVSKDGGAPQEQPVVWESVGAAGEFEARLTLTDDGDYVVQMTYMDRSGNEMPPYTSETIVVDTMAPVIEFCYDDYSCENPQTATITVTEHNFCQSDIKVATEAKTIAGQDVSVKDLQNYLQTCQWEHEGDVHRAYLSDQLVDAVYVLTCNYSDLALNQAAELRTEEFVVDHTPPSADRMSVSYSAPVKDTVLSAITLGFYNPTVTVTFTAYDDTAGMDYFTWSYMRQEGVSTENVELYEDTGIAAVQDLADKDKFTASVTLPREQAQQLRGTIAFTATDKCGNVSDKRTDSGYVLVVDTISPAITVEYSSPEKTYEGKLYYSKALTVTFTVTEANFFSEDVVVTLKKDNEAPVQVEPDWRDISADVHVGIYVIDAPDNHEGDGEYVVEMTYTDRSGNEMPPYTSEIIVVDTTAPVIEFCYDDYSCENPQTATITVTEHNFCQSDIKVATEAKTITGQDVSVKNLQNYLQTCQWEHEGDVHRAYLSDQLAEARYVLTCNYSDLALNQAAELRTEEFVVDHTPPSADRMSVSYSASVKDTVLSVITLGFYNPTVIVTFTAYDDTAGVDYFTWSYMRQEGVSTENVELYADTRIAAVQDLAAKDRFTASVTLPREQAQQLRGTIAFTATDKCGNVSDKRTDSGYVLVVDTISPAITVEYSSPEKTYEGKLYYSKALTVTFTVTEANFFSEDVVVTLKKDNEAPVQVEPDWRDISADVHVGTYVIDAPDNHEGDGEYVVEMTYTDRSGNEMPPYTSEIIVVDTTVPVIEFCYDDYSCENPQTATITVTEHNFCQSDIKVATEAKTITGQDVSVKDLQDYLQNYLQTCQWEHEGDVHRAYLSDQLAEARYVLTCNYSDLALNQAAELRTEEFVVDHTPPSADRMSVSYSASVKDTVLSVITLGFYNPTVTVTFTAYDDTAGVDYFTWSYMRQEGVSTENVELYKDTRIAAVQDLEAKDRFTASVTLPREQAQQLRGTIAFTATDKCGNLSNKWTDSGYVLVVDTISPVITAEYTSPDGKSEGMLYYSKALTATFTVTEANFFSEDVGVTLKKDNGTPVQVEPDWRDISSDVHVGTYVIDAPDNHNNDGDYVLTVYYTDRSDNTMETYTSNVLVVDTISPVRSVSYGLPDGGGPCQTVGTKHYFSGSVEFVFQITEANFFAEDVHITVSKDGEQDREQTVTWESAGAAGENGEYETRLTLTDDGDYVVKMTYTDRSGNEMPPYTSETIVVDTTAPVIEFCYDDYSCENPQTATITVTEHNFCQSDIEVATEAKTITGQDVSVKDLQNYLQTCQWEHEGDVHKAYLSEQFADAIYVLTCNYRDLAQNQAAELRTEKFVVDHTPPSADRMSVSYSASVKDTVLSVITLGFYNPTVTVTFTACDDTAGVDYFTWSYMRQEGVSTENVELYEDTRIAAVQDLEAKDRFTASVTLPREQAQQLRGTIAFTATDKCGNLSNKWTDSGYVLVVDTISPVITAEYTSPDDISGGKLYYNKALTATFTVTEANFFSEDVDVKLAKDNEAPVQVVPVWTDTSADEHVGTYVIDAPDNHAGDGVYVFTVTYTDRSNNTMEVYTSDKLVVDTISPERIVSYGLRDAGGTCQTVGTKHYFSGPVDVVFHITETNFFAEDAHITVSKDGGQMREQSVTWKSTGAAGEYEARLTLTDDGDYVVSMTYTDRTGHEMPPYTSETIVVDATAPVIEFRYSDYSGESPQMATITVTEHNFRQGDITVTTEAKTITDLGVSVEDLQYYLRNCQWVHEGDVHRAYLSDQFADAIYVLTCNYRDLALNQAAEVRTEQFVVDHTPPATDRMSISYSVSVMDTVLSAITLGFYNPRVTVTFMAYDDTAGVDYFTWSYMRQEGVSTENVELYEDTRIAAVQDSADKAKFTASVTLPREQVQQLRGIIAFTATDRYGNESDKLTDSGHVLVVDTISPAITAEYTPPDNTFGGKLYYNKALTATFTVTEANFFSEDVVVTLAKDNETPVQVEPVWTDISADVHVGTYVINAPDNHAGDGDYVFTVNYTDRSNNTMEVYTSNVFVIDTILPVIEVEYSDRNPVNTMADFQGITRQYFPAELSATLTITEHNFNPEDINYIITATDVAGNALNAEALYRSTRWTSNEDINTATIVYPGDANYSFDIEYIDLALHEMADYPTEYFTVDASMPENLEVSYSASVLETILANISFGFYNAQMTVRVTAVDRISGVHGFEYGYLKTEGVSAVNAELDQQPIEETQISFSEGGATATASFQISQAALAAGNQFNGTVEVSAADRAGNQTDYLRDVKRIVVDNIAPTATVEYNVPVQVVNDISYYDGDINATVTVNEANFYSEDVTVSVTRGGAPYAVTPVWNDNSTDVHTGTFTLTGDGDYFVEITYSDKSGNVMQQYTSEQMTIDTQIAEASITVNGMDADGKAFKDEVVLTVSFEDTNFEDYEILLTRTSFANKNNDVTEQFIGGQITTNAFGGSGSFDTFSRTPENDGIYTVTLTLFDKAGHTMKKTATFTVNRYGSVYEYSDYLVDLIKDGGAYVQKVKEDLLITEYNADRLVSQSLNIEISRDGKPLDSYDYRVTPEINDAAETGDKGWYQYQYTILKENFSADGVYKISVSSADQTGNTPENINYEDKAILFRVDSTAPEINSVTGLESAIVNATSLDIKYTVFDTIGLESVAVYVDGKERDDITDFAGDAQNYFGSLLLMENPQAQKVRLVVRDLAGNVTDTDAEDFVSAFAFNSSVTISTNAIVRWYANKALFWGSIGGAVTVVGTGTGGAILFRRRRRRTAKA